MNFLFALLLYPASLWPDVCPVQPVGKRPFYIIYHNPNLVGHADEEGSAIHALKNGANALAPDLVFHEGKLLVHHHNNKLDDKDNAPLLTDYLDNLAEALLADTSLKLYMVAIDIKNTDDQAFEFEMAQKIFQEHFSNRIPGMKIIFTTPDDFDFLLKEVGPNLVPGQSMGTDEYGKPAEVHERLKDSGYPYVYSHGNSMLFHNLYKPIKEAVRLRDAGNSFELVYPWVINTARNFRRYIEVGVDGIMTNRPAALKKIIEKDYSDTLTLSGPEFESMLVR